MKITHVKVSLCNEDKLKGFANVIFDDLFLIRGLKIIRGIERYFVAMPSKRRNNGTYIDIAHPIDHGFRKRLERAVLEKYWQDLKRVESGQVVVDDVDEGWDSFP